MGHYSCVSLCAGEEVGQAMASVLLRSQFSTDCHSGAALGGVEYEGAISVSLYQNIEKFSGRYIVISRKKYGE